MFGFFSPSCRRKPNEPRRCGRGSPGWWWWWCCCFYSAGVPSRYWFSYKRSVRRIWVTVIRSTNWRSGLTACPIPTRPSTRWSTPSWVPTSERPSGACALSSSKGMEEYQSFSPPITARWTFFHPDLKRQTGKVMLLDLWKTQSCTFDTQIQSQTCHMGQNG